MWPVKPLVCTVYVNTALGETTGTSRLQTVGKKITQLKNCVSSARLCDEVRCVFPESWIERCLNESESKRYSSHTSLGNMSNDERKRRRRHTRHHIGSPVVVVDCMSPHATTHTQTESSSVCFNVNGNMCMTWSLITIDMGPWFVLQMRKKRTTEPRSHIRHRRLWNGEFYNVYNERLSSNVQQSVTTTWCARISRLDEQAGGWIAGGRNFFRIMIYSRRVFPWGTWSFGWLLPQSRRRYPAQSQHIHKKVIIYENFCFSICVKLKKNTTLFLVLW